jgi:hypothetical protein
MNSAFCALAIYIYRGSNTREKAREKEKERRRKRKRRVKTKRKVFRTRKEIFFVPSTDSQKKRILLKKPTP